MTAEFEAAVGRISRYVIYAERLRHRLAVSARFFVGEIAMEPERSADGPKANIAINLSANFAVLLSCPAANHHPPVTSQHAPANAPVQGLGAVSQSLSSGSASDSPRSDLA